MLERSLEPTTNTSRRETESAINFDELFMRFREQLLHSGETFDEYTKNIDRENEQVVRGATIDRLLEAFAEFARGPLYRIPESTITQWQAPFYQTMESEFDRLVSAKRAIHKSEGKMSKPINADDWDYRKRLAEEDARRHGVPQPKRQSDIRPSNGSSIRS